LNALVTAAVHPLAQVVAIDTDAAQIARLRRDAAAARLDNLQAIQSDFRTLSDEEAGEPFDVVATYGVLS
jgi:16S rRNA C967 or C1407 C5-methylase (RsmB/RsmF family)